MGVVVTVSVFGLADTQSISIESDQLELVYVHVDVHVGTMHNLRAYIIQN